jgi:hypothetical protein
MTYIGPKRVPREIELMPSREHSVPLSKQHQIGIFTFDPGGTTGWSLMLLPHNVFDEYNDQQKVLQHTLKWFHGQVDCLKPDLELGIWRIKQMIDLYPQAAIVFEDFWVRQLAADTTPLEIIAAVRLHLWEKGRRMFIQSASQAKTTATDERLKLWNCYTREGGLQHARDADRHAILFLRKCLGHKGIQLRKEAWPHVYQESNHS